MDLNTQAAGLGLNESTETSAPPALGRRISVVTLNGDTSEWREAVEGTVARLVARALLAASCTHQAPGVGP